MGRPPIGRARGDAGTSGGAPRRRAGAGSAPSRAPQPSQLLDALKRARVEFVVIGGFSLAAHGVVRATEDVDIVPEPSRGNLSRLAAALDALAAQGDVSDMEAAELGLAPDARGLSAGGNWGLETSLGRLDVMADVPGLRDYKHLRSGAVEVDGTLYAGYDELISMKAASGRDEDLRDIGALEAARRTD